MSSICSFIGDVFPFVIVHAWIAALIIKGTICDRQFQTSLFPKPQIFLHIQGEHNCNNLPIQQLSQKQHIFGKRDNSLLLGINYRWWWLILASVSSKKSFKALFSEVLVYFSIWGFWDSKMFHIISLLKWFMCFIERETHNFILQFREIFLWRETVLRAHRLKSAVFLSNLCDCVREKWYLLWLTGIFLYIWKVLRFLRLSLIVPLNFKCNKQSFSIDSQ